MYLSTYSRSLWLPALDPPVPPLSPLKVHVNDPLWPLLVPALPQSTCTWPYPIVTSSSPLKVHVSVRQVHVPGWTPPLSPRKVHVNDPLQPLLVPALSQSTCTRPFPKVQVLGAVDQGSIPPRVSYFT